MDQVDMNLIRELWLDSRISFNKLGKILELSGNILKKRAEKLEENEVFVYHTNPVFSQFGYARIVFVAEIPKKDREEFIKKVSEFDLIYEIIFSLSEKCAVVVLLPFENEDGVSTDTINNFKQKFKEKLPEVQLLNYYKMKFAPVQYGKNLKKMEINLIRLLRQDSRKDLIHLSKQLGLSKKTLSRYLHKFTNNKLIRHTIGLQPSKIRNHLIYLLFIELKDIENMGEYVEELKEKIGTWFSYYEFVGPNKGVAFYIYAETLYEMEEKIKELYNLPKINDIDVFFPSSIVRFNKWIDTVLKIQE